MSFDKSDLDLNDKIEQFYDSTDQVWLANYMIIKSDLSNIVLDVPATTLLNINANRSQVHHKHNNLNILIEKSRDDWLRYEFERLLFNAKNTITYQHGETSPDIYNKFEDYLSSDSSMQLLAKVDLSTILAPYDNNVGLSQLLAHTNGSYVKHIFNVYSISAYNKQTTTYSESINYYNNFIAAYFKNDTTVLRSSIALNKFLYSTFYTNNRKSQINIDFHNDLDYITVSFFDIKVTPENIVIRRYKYNTTWS
jgi:hypothetical protein